MGDLEIRGDFGFRGEFEARYLGGGDLLPYLRIGVLDLLSGDLERLLGFGEEETDLLSLTGGGDFGFCEYEGDFE